MDIVGVGIGPFNLSLAALLQPVTDLHSQFFDRRAQFQWHAGLLFPEATIQVSFLKDLVTLADPTSPYSFLAFLFAHQRMYRFVNAGFNKVNRREFSQYLQWVSEALGNLEFGQQVEAVEYSGGDALTVRLSHAAVGARNLVLGTGLTPKVPPCAQLHLGPTVFHAGEYLARRPSTAGRRVAVIGGGQSGAEVVFHLLSQPAGLPRSLLWISRRAGFLPLDDTPFTSELFSPAYCDHFFRLPAEQRRRLLTEQALASDGIDPALLKALYRRLYELDFLEGREGLCCLCSGCELVGLAATSGGWKLALCTLHGGGEAAVEADLVLLATGAEYRRPACLDGIAGRIAWGPDGYQVREDYSLEWDGPETIRIYVQNAARPQRGIADPNLSLMAWRSARIVNSLAGRKVYDIEEASSVRCWEEADNRLADPADWRRRRALGRRR